jgi:hypothetical protein
VTVRFVPNRNLARDLAADPPPELRRSLLDIGRDLAVTARETAFREYYRTGAYMRGIREPEVTRNQKGELAVRVAATDWKSHWAERPPKQEHGRKGRILRRAALRARRRAS